MDLPAVLMVHNRYQQRGGEDAVFEAEVELLRQHGHRTVTLEFHNDEIPSHRSPLDAARLAARTIWSRESAEQVRRLIAQERPDIAHFHNTFPLISPSALHACRAAGLPVVLTLHNYRLICPAATLFRDGAVCEECVGRMPWPSVKHRCYHGSRAESALVATANSAHRLRRTWQRDVSTFVALTEFARSKLIAGGLPAERIAVKPNFLTPDPGAGDGSGDFVLFVGRLERTKGVPVLLDAWLSGQVDQPLHIIGDGPLAEEVRAAASSHPRITWLGRQERATVLEQMRQARALAFPSVWYESCPVTLIEALACGLPVVAPRLGAMAELIRDGETGLLYEPPADSRSLAAAVRRMLEDRPLRATLAHQARADYLTRYTGEVGYVRLRAIYERAIDS